MKKAFGWSITFVGILSVVFLLGMFAGRKSMRIPDNNATVSSVIPQSTGIVNINTANAEQLQTLPGIGETLALRIIEYRETNGLFQNILQLKSVDGIGEGKLQEIIHLICVEDKP